VLKEMTSVDERHLLLLGLLQHQEMHGYQINDFIERQMSLCTNIKKATAYYLLDQMAKEGYVTQTAQRAGNRPLRKVYHITPAGQDVFFRWLRENLTEIGWPTFAFDVGLAFLDSLPPEESRKLLRRRLDRIRERIAYLKSVEHHADSLKSITDRHVALLKAEEEWLCRFIESLPRSRD